MKKSFIIIALLLAVATLAIVCQQGPSRGSAGEAAVQDQFGIKFQSTPPKDTVSNATPEQLAAFAWEEFFALNWQSDYNTSKMRDHPDPNWSYESDKKPYPDLVVWETYAHRTELRPADGKMLPFDSGPKYSYRQQPAVANGADYTLFHNLDENNEIGSCDIYAFVNSLITQGPRPNTRSNKNNRVLYQAKTNRDEYDYIMTNYPDSVKLDSATARTMRNIQNYTAYFQGTNNNSTCNCPVEDAVICLPCGGAQIPGKNGQTYTGAIEVKTAWRRLGQSEDHSRYFKREVIVYESRNGKLTAVNDTFGLIGIHIIHKTVNYPAFIFATFEQVDVEQSNMGYSELDQNGRDTGSLHANYPRLHPIPAVADSATAAAHQLLKQKNPNSVWQYYRLVGVQAAPTNDSNASSYFLANYVIESDSTLANFRGNSIDSPHNGKHNVLYNKQYYTVGGCQGCHGAAQINLGTDFSFLLDHNDKPVTAPDPGLPGSKLQRYIQTFQRARLTQQTTAARR